MLCHVERSSFITATSTLLRVQERLPGPLFGLPYPGVQQREASSGLFLCVQWAASWPLVTPQKGWIALVELPWVLDTA